MSDAISSIQLVWSLWFEARSSEALLQGLVATGMKIPEARLLKDVVKGLGFMWLLEASKELNRMQWLVYSLRLY